MWQQTCGVLPFWRKKGSCRSSHQVCGRKQLWCRGVRSCGTPESCGSGGSVAGKAAAGLLTGVCSLVWRPSISRSTCMGLPDLSKPVLVQGTAPAGWLWGTGWRWAGQDSYRAAGCWLLFSSHLWHWWEWTWVWGTGHRQPVLHWSAVPSGWARWSAGLEGHLLGDCGHWFSVPAAPWVHESSTIRMCVFVIE